MTAPAADDRLTLMGLFAEAWGGIRALATAQLARHGLSPVEFDVLLRLTRSPRGMLRMSDLAAQTSLSTSGVTRVVDRLAACGLVDRQACDLDRRSTYAVVTDGGRARLDALLPEHLELISQWVVDPLSPAERAALETALRRLRDHVRPGATAGADGLPTYGAGPADDQPGSRSRSSAMSPP